MCRKHRKLLHVYVQAFSMLVNRGKWVAINLFPKASLHVGTNMSIGIFMFFFALSNSALMFNVVSKIGLE